MAAVCAAVFAACASLGHPEAGALIAASIALCSACDDPYIGPWTDVERKNRI